jgi:hypothetical protein
VTPLKAIDRFTSLTIIGMMKIMCNNENKYLATYAFIDNLVNEWGGEIILWKGLIQITEFHTYVNRSFLFVDQNRV